MQQTITIAIDAMGGDNAPQAIIEGTAKMARKHPHIRFMIFGDELRVRPLLTKYKQLALVSELVHTDKHIRMDDKPSSALRKGKGSSMRLAIEAVEQGAADAVVSAGNTGALMAMAKMILKSLPGIHRPAIASAFPSMKGSCVMLDLGANVLVDAENLVQFAVLGAVFAKAHKNISTPTVGLLNVGSEDTKGPDHVREAAKLMQKIDFPGMYQGFVEGNDIGMGSVDVVVCDGYAGNIALKTAEGIGKLTRHYFKETLFKDPLGLLGSFIAGFALKSLKRKLDPRLYNGGVFLGLNGLCVKSHGGCDALAFSRAIHMAIGLAEKGYIQTVAQDISNLVNQENFLAQGA